MRRRDFFRVLGAAGNWPLFAWAEQSTRSYSIGLLRIGQPPVSFIEPFRQGLKDLGYIEGENLVIEFGLATTAEQLPAAAAGLIRRHVDLILASGAAAVLPARDAASGTPVVFVAGIDPIATGLAAEGLTRPTSNVTGLSTIQIDLTAKRMQLLKEVLPSLKCVAFLVRESNPGRGQYVAEAERAAKALGLDLLVVAASGPDDLEQAFRAARSGGANALVPMDDAGFTSARRALVRLGDEHQLPGIYPISEFVADGGLISLGPNYREVYRRAATIVDKVLKGTSPADLPVEQPTTFDIAVNLKAAKRLNIAVPASLIARADEVIE